MGLEYGNTGNAVSKKNFLTKLGENSTVPSTVSYDKDNNNMNTTRHETYGLLYACQQGNYL